MVELAKYTLYHDLVDRIWILRRDGAMRALKRFKKKSDALAFLPNRFGDNYPASVKIQRQDGVIEEERTYPRSMDPLASKG